MYVCACVFVWCANIVVRNQLQLFILAYRNTHSNSFYVYLVSVIVCACATYRNEQIFWREYLGIYPLHHVSVLIPRWRYHYKLHGINIHLPIYSMSCGSNTMHMLFLLSLCILSSLYEYARFKCPKSKNRHYLWDAIACALNLLFHISYIQYSIHDTDH